MASAPVLIESNLSRRAITKAVGNHQLDSWKEIAAFFARNTRTVQRWERTEGLPIHRHIHEKCGSVYAFEGELIAWRATRSAQLADHLGTGRPSHDRLRLAVLPFANLSRGSQFRLFGDGLTCELITQLALLDPARLGVIARTTVMSYTQIRFDIKEIGRRLHADYLLEGSVRFGARQMRLSARLINANDQTQVFADTCGRRTTDSVSLQVAFAKRIAVMVSERLLS